MRPIISSHAACDLGPSCTFTEHPPDYLHAHACHALCKVSVCRVGSRVEVQIVDSGAGYWAWHCHNAPDWQIETLLRWLDALAYIDPQAVESRLVGWVRD